ncbi:MAG: DUF2208 family protein [Sulfolobales archaeon]
MHHRILSLYATKYRRCIKLSYYLTRKAMVRSLLISQGIIALFVIINLFVPPEYHGIIMTLYFIVFMSVFFLSAVRQRRKGSDVKEIVTGRKILVIKQEEVVELQSKDLELVKELKPLLKASGFSILSMVIILVWFFVVYPTYVQHYFSTTDNGLLGQVLKLLTLYEVPVVISLIIQMGSRRLVKKYVNVLRSAEVYTTGIIGVPGFALKFPIQGYAVRVCPSRKFVDFAKSEGSVEVLFRIYTNDAEKLADIISRYGKIRVSRTA